MLHRLARTPHQRESMTREACNVRCFGIRRIWLVAAVLPMLPSAIMGQTIRGVVVESGTRKPVNLASVLIFSAAGDSVAGALTDSTGFFSLPAPEEDFAIRVRGLGYRTERIGPFFLTSGNAVRVIEVALDPQPLSIEGVSVEARLPALDETGFYQRMVEGRGQFLTPSDIAESDAWFTPELFYELDNVRPQYSEAPWARWVSLINATGGGSCEPRIFVDGVWLRPEFRRPGEGLDDAVPVEDLLAAEVYWGPFQAPMKFQGTTKDNSCGVVVLWTRSGTAARR